jgi:hypothetical protein
MSVVDAPSVHAQGKPVHDVELMRIAGAQEGALVLPAVPMCCRHPVCARLPAPGCGGVPQDEPFAQGSVRVGLPSDTCFACSQRWKGVLGTS